MHNDWTETLMPLALSIAAAVLLCALAVVRVWRLQRPLRAPHPNAATAGRFAWGFSGAVLLWLAYALPAGYGRFFQPDSARQLLLYADALWSTPLFIGAIAWAAGVGVGWVLKLLQREHR